MNKAALRPDPTRYHQAHRVKVTPALSHGQEWGRADKSFYNDARHDLHPGNPRLMVVARKRLIVARTANAKGH